MALRFYVAVMALMGVGVGVLGAYNEPDWGFQFYLHGPAALDCNHSSLIVQDYNFVEWELPDKRVVSQGNSKYQLSNVGRVAHMRLTVQNLSDADAGVYVCHVYTHHKGPKRGWLLRGLNLGGPKYREPFDEYRYNLLVGGIAALVLFVPLVTMCFVYKFRYQTKEQKRNKYAMREDLSRHQRHLDINGKGAELSDIKGESNEAFYGDEYIGTDL